MTLLTEHDPADGRELRSLRLEATGDGKSVLLIEIDERKPGIHRDPLARRRTAGRTPRRRFARAHPFVRFRR